MTSFDRLQIAASVVAIASIPLFPSFITLTNVAYPGVSVVPLPLALTLMGAMLVLAVVAVVALLRPPRSAPALRWPLLAWLGAALLSLLFGFNPRDGAVFVGILALTILWHAHIDRFYGRIPGLARAYWWAFLVSGALAALAAIAMVLVRIPAAQYTIANGRAVGTFVLPGELAGYLLFFLPIAFALARGARSAALRVVAWCGLGIGAIAMLMTFSRTGWVGLAAGIAFFVVMRSRGRTRYVQGGVIVAAALAIVLLLFNEHHNPSENYTRLSIWQAAIGIINRFPLTGVGPFGFSKIYPQVRLPDGDPTAFHAHSMYLTFFAELGVVGFLAFCWLMWSFWREWYRRVEHGAQPSLLATAIAAGVVGGLVQGLIDTVSVVIFGLLLPMLALALSAARSDE